MKLQLLFIFLKKWLHPIKYFYKNKASYNSSIEDPSHCQGWDSVSLSGPCWFSTFMYTHLKALGAEHSPASTANTLLASTCLELGLRSEEKQRNGHQPLWEMRFLLCKNWLHLWEEEGFDKLIHSSFSSLLLSFHSSDSAWTPRKCPSWCQHADLLSMWVLGQESEVSPWRLKRG